MFQEIYGWIESYAGANYDCSDLYIEIGSTAAFVDPYQWWLNIRMIVDHLTSALEIVDQFGDQIPETLPDADMMKHMLYDATVQQVRANVFAVEKQLQIQYEENDTDLLTQTTTLKDLIQMCVNDDLDEITSTSFDRYNEENDDALTEVLSVYKQDMMNIQSTVRDIRQSYFESIDEN